MARQYLIPGVGFINETGGRQYLIPGTAYLNDTGSAGTTLIPATASLALTEYAAPLKSTIPAAKASVAITGRAAALRLVVPVPPTALVTAKFAPALKYTLRPGAIALTITEYSPTLAAVATLYLSPGYAVLALSGSMPAITGTSGLRHIYRVDQSGTGGDIYAGVQTGSGKQFRATAGSGKVYRA